MSEKVSLSELQLIIRDSLYTALPDSYWVMAEISELKENYAGHCYLELIEKNPDEKNVRARIKAIIWNSRYRFLKALFENVTGEALRDGLKILVKTKVEYHELYGLSLIISDIDPAFTVGEMAMKRQLVIKRLEQEGVFSMNKELKFPVLPQRIAIISSRNAAGYSDFINHLKGNTFGYVFFTALIDTSMQGKETEQGVVDALDKIALNFHLFDLAVIIRGGGSQSDLSWFDSYNIAYHVTQFPLPVITGIGHDKDTTVTDMVANRSLKTPTAVADFLIDCVAGVENHINEMGTLIINASRNIIERNKNRIETSGIKLLPLVRLMISDLKDRLSTEIIEIINTGKKLVYSAGLISESKASRLVSAVKSYSLKKETLLMKNQESIVTSVSNLLLTKNIRLVTLDNTLKILSPENVLHRGYSVTSVNGKILKSTDQIRNGDLIDTQLYKGKLRSKVFGTKERKENVKKESMPGQLSVNFE
jgi:exodeoxyribonuclease VII large subunit